MTDSRGMSQVLLRRHHGWTKGLLKVTRSGHGYCCILDMYRYTNRLARNTTRNGEAAATSARTYSAGLHVQQYATPSVGSDDRGDNSVGYASRTDQRPLTPSRFQTQAHQHRLGSVPPQQRLRTSTVPDSMSDSMSLHRSARLTGGTTRGGNALRAENNNVNK